MDEGRSFITVVTGLPRSGTSMLMQMLAAGGMRVVTDDLRSADDSNPRGYLEDERVKSLRTDNGWLAEAEGAAVKVICQLLTHLPAEHNYRLVWVERDVHEVLRSQSKMLERDGKKGASMPEDKLAGIFQKQAAAAKQWVSQLSNHQLLSVAHREVIADPAATATALDEFLGSSLDTDAMAAAVDPSLYRNRA